MSKTAFHRPPAQNVPSYAEQLIASYSNCRDALNTFQAEGESKEARAIGGTSEFNSDVAIERFVGQTWVLEAMITKSFKTPAYDKVVAAIVWPPMPKEGDPNPWTMFRPALSLFNAITELFEENHLWRARPVIGES